MKKLLHFISSPLMLVSLALPMIVWYAAAVYWMKLSPVDAAGTVSFRAYYAVLVLSVSVFVLNSAFNRAYGRALLDAGLLLILFQGIVWYGFRFSGRMDIGEGETFEKYSNIEAGPWARPVQLPLSLKAVKPGGPAAGTVVLANEEQEISQGREFIWRGMGLRVTGSYSAPLFTLSNNQGTELEGGYIKLTLQEPDSDFFQFRIVPHRFYVSLPGRATRMWKSNEGKWALVEGEKREGGDGLLTGTPEKLHLRIVRGKLTLFNKEIRRGEAITFDGHTIRFEQGAPWVRIEVERRQGLYLFYAGLAAVLAGALMTAGRRGA